MNKKLLNIIITSFSLLPIVLLIILNTLPSPIISAILDRNILCSSVGSTSKLPSNCYATDQKFYSTPPELYAPLQNHEIPLDAQATEAFNWLAGAFFVLMAINAIVLLKIKNRFNTGYRYIDIKDLGNEKKQLKNIIIITAVFVIITIVTYILIR